MAKLGVLVGLVLVLTGCGDKAEPGFRECERLQKAAKLEEARETCHLAATQSPTSGYGIKAIRKIDELTAKIDEIIPTTVTVEWCSRLSARLLPRLIAGAKAKSPGMNAAYIEQAVAQHLQNMEYNCQRDAVSRRKINRKMSASARSRPASMGGPSFKSRGT